MFNVSLIIPGPTDATSWYRGVGPFAAIAKTTKNIFFSSHTVVNWAVAQTSDLFFFQRPHTADQVKAAWMAKKAGAGVWLDYDDDLLAVPPENPTYPIYSEKSVSHNLKKIIEIADVVTVTTTALKEKLFKSFGHEKKIKIIPNALNDFVLPLPEKLSPRQRLIMWRGSQTHAHDLMSYSQDIIDVSKKYDEWTFCFVGDNPWYITNKMRPGSFVVPPAQPIDEFWDFIKIAAPAIQIVPLADNDFNRSKSNIAWIEATWSGAVTLAPNFESWHVPGVVHYERDTFREKLCSMIDDFESQNKATMARLIESRDFIRSNLLLSKTNKARKAIIDDFYMKRQSRLSTL